MDRPKGQPGSVNFQREEKDPRRLRPWNPVDHSGVSEANLAQEAAGNFWNFFFFFFPPRELQLEMAFLHSQAAKSNCVVVIIPWVISWLKMICCSPASPVGLFPLP